MKINDLKISVQLRLSLGAILIVVIGLAWFSWYQTSSIWISAESLYNHPLKTRRAIYEIKSSVLSMRVDMRDLLLATEDSTRQKVLNDIDANQANVLQQVEMLKQCYLGSPTDIDEFVKEYSIWVSIRNETIRLISAGRLEEARQRHVPGGLAPKQAYKVLGCIEQISDFAITKADEFYFSAERAKNTLLNWLLIAIIAIIAFASVIVYLLVRRIGQPLQQLTLVTEQYQMGKFDARFNYQSKNEFGKLSASFNKLADTIETELNLSAETNKISEVMLSEDDAHRFCHSILNSLLQQTGSQLGAVYLLNDDKTLFEAFECIGMEESLCKPFSSIRYEGEFGASLSSKKIQHIKSIPDESRHSFKIIGGSFAPREIITIPVIVGGDVLAMISLATISEFKKDSLRLINTILNTLSARMDGVLTYRKLIKFSQKLEQQNSELEAQKIEMTAQAAELTEQNVELEMQKMQLDEVNRLKTSFLSNMSHELRTPLNSVIALSAVLNRRLEGKVPQEEYSYLDIIERNGKQLLALINDILDLSRIEAGKEEIEVNLFAAQDIISDVVGVVMIQAIEKGIELLFSVDDSDLKINSDYGKCHHILQNLVANAVKFTEQGKVEIIAKVEHDNVIFEVSDSGIGILPEDLSLIFDEFRQADSTNARKYGGTGLGLAIAKKYAEMLGGKISVSSTFGKGSVFSLLLPISYSGCVASNQEMPVMHTTSHSEELARNVILSSSVKTILLVEDTEAMVVQMRDMLEHQGYKVMLARNGNEALAQISQSVPDAMILDLMMPEVDGFEVLQRVRSKEKTASLPVIILTAKYVSKQELSFLKNNGIFQLIQKGDVNKEQLLEAVARMLIAKPIVDGSSNEKPRPKHVSGKAKILVVEDNPDNMLTIKAMLGESYIILEATDGISGLSLAKEHNPDLILMDIALPVITGIEALQEIRQQPTVKDIPVIAVSASAMKGDKESFMAMGFDGYISKPIDNERFYKLLKEWLV